MATSLTTLNSSPNLETQFFSVLEQFSDLQKAYAAANPEAEPKLIITTYTRDHLSGQITGTFELPSTTVQDADGTVIVVPTPQTFS